jgi:hypothetical protein
MRIIDVVNSEAGLTLVSGLLGGIWTFFRSTDLYRRAKERRFAKAVQALEAGVEQTYRTYVKAIKDAREDGKLTEEEARVARQRARDAAIEFGRTQGVDVLGTLGAEFADLWISKLVQRAKRA